MPKDLQLPSGPVRLPTIDDLRPAGQRVLVRVDFNVPLADGEVTDDLRLKAALPTLTELVDRGGALVLMSHLGRPEGVDERFSMAPVGDSLADLMGRPVRTVADVVGPAARAAASEVVPGDILLLENLRFDPGEKANDPELSAALAELGEAYVNDAFGTAHRAAASVVGVTEHLPSYAGRLMERELEMLGGALADPESPFAVVLGGAKVADKIGVIEALLPRADFLLVGGGMANTFLAAQGVPMGASLVDEGGLDEARRLLREAEGRIVLPVDHVVADAFDAEARTRIASAADGVPDGWQALDIGPATIEEFESRLRTAKTVVWNGPMGVFELGPFASGTLAVARMLAEAEGTLTIVGGGDSAAAVRAAGLGDAMSWVSTGGGASLELLEGKPLPAVVALEA